jgi:hypothetical protein
VQAASPGIKGASLEIISQKTSIAVETIESIKK